MLQEESLEHSNPVLLMFSVVANSAKNVGRRTSGKDKNTRNANIGSGSASVATSMSSSETCYQKNQSECLDALCEYITRPQIFVAESVRVLYLPICVYSDTVSYLLIYLLSYYNLTHLLITNLLTYFIN